MMGPSPGPGTPNVPHGMQGQSDYSQDSMYPMHKVLFLKSSTTANKHKTHLFKSVLGTHLHFITNFPAETIMYILII